MIIDCRFKDVGDNGNNGQSDDTYRLLAIAETSPKRAKSECSLTPASC